MIYFKKIKIIGFGSIDKLEFEFDNSGIHVIKGKNGSGKTSILNALYWGLYGDTLKEKASVERWEHLKEEGYKGVMVEIELEKFDQTHYITRFSSYQGKYNGAKGGNRLILSSSEGSYKRDVQNDINRLLGVSSELFKSSILFGQKMKRIIEDSGANKKKVLEQCFDHSKLEDIIEKVKQDNDKLNDILQGLSNYLVDQYSLEEKLNYKIDKAKSEYKHQKELYDKEKKHIEQRLEDISSLVDTYKENKKKLFDLDTTINKTDIEKLRKEEKDKAKESSDSWELVIELRNDIKNTKEQIRSLDKDSICKACGQEIKDIPTAQIEKLNIELSKLETKLTKANKSYDVKSKKLDDITTKVLQYENTLNDSKDIEEWMVNNNPTQRKKDLKNQLKQLKEPAAQDTKQWEDELKKALENIKVKELEEKKYKKAQDFNNWVLKDPLSNKGIKAYMFDLLLDDINEHLIKYSHILGLRAEFSVNYDRANKDIILNIYDEHGHCIPYVDLSGGQGQIINVATALAFHDLVNSNIPFNILILDEVFESLDSDNIEKVNSLLEVKSNETSIIIITHQESFNPRNATITNLKLVEGLTGVV